MRLGAKTTRFYKTVPKDLAANLRYRQQLLQAAEKSLGLQEDLRTICRRDLHFYVNAFCWIYEPRDAQVLPFITWDFQDECLEEVLKAVGSHDLVIEKSRDMGASWMMLAVVEWLWHFYPNQSFLLASRKEEYVDKTGDPKSLFGKIDLLHRYQPGWLLPRLACQSMHLGNLDNNSTIDGESTNQDIARGDRRTAIVLDEFASVQNSHAIKAAASQATKCLLMNSTPKGTGNSFYDTAHDGKTVKMRLHWTRHPQKQAGLYQDEQGRPRSPWYDRECQRLGHSMMVAQELDINYLGSSFQFFDPIQIEACIARDAHTPFLGGELDYEVQTNRPRAFLEREEGSLHLWIHPMIEDGRPPVDEYVIGADIAAGTGASNSCLSVARRRTGEKVAAYVNPKIRPEAFARLAVALAWWFRGAEEGAFLIWEANGPGRNFGDKVIELGYRNVYYRKDELSLSKKQTDTPGWWATPDNKRAVLSDYREALGVRFVNRSRDALRECLEYVYVPGNDTVEHALAINTIDPSGAKSNHGDRVIADALAWKAAKEHGRPEEPDPETSPPVGSLAHRRQMIRRRRLQESSW